MHETSLLQCLFGCSAPDSLQHYTECPRLRYAVVAALGGALPVPAPTVKEFLALPPPYNSKGGIYCVFVSFTVYHVVKSRFFNYNSPRLLPQSTLNQAVLAFIARAAKETLAGLVGDFDVARGPYATGAATAAGQ